MTPQALGQKLIRLKMDDLKEVTPILLICTLVILLVVCFLLSLLIGPMKLSMQEILLSLWHALTAQSFDQPSTSAVDWVVRELRLPRAILAVIVGAGLAVAGAVAQGVFRNPLADPALIGIASGAALAAVAVIVLSNSLLAGWVILSGAFALPIAAFFGCLLVTLIIYRLATHQGQTQVALLLLAGIAINLLTGAGTALLTYMADDQELRDLTFWSMGSLARGSWPQVLALILFVLLPLLLMMRSARLLNAMLMGENVALHLGFDVQRQKRWLLLGLALITGAAVAITGIIGFVGLVVPHLLRLVIGADYRLLLPLSALAGACLLLIADTLARTVLAPAELPVGLVMALIGSPIFILLLIQQARKWS